MLFMLGSSSTSTPIAVTGSCSTEACAGEIPASPIRLLIIPLTSSPEFAVMLILACEGVGAMPPHSANESALSLTTCGLITFGFPASNSAKRFNTSIIFVISFSSDLRLVLIRRFYLRPNLYYILQ